MKNYFLSNFLMTTNWFFIVSGSALSKLNIFLIWELNNYVLWKGFLFAIEIYSRMIFFSCTASIDVSDAIMSSLFFTVKHFWTELVTLNQQNKAIIPARNFCQDPSKHFPCTKKFNTCFKIIIKNLVGGQLAWVLARATSEGRKLLAQEEILLVLCQTRRQAFFQVLCRAKKTSARPPVWEEYSLILDEWIYESTCPSRRVEFAGKKKMFFSTEVRVPKHFGLCKLTRVSQSLGSFRGNLIVCFRLF